MSTPVYASVRAARRAAGRPPAPSRRSTLTPRRAAVQTMAMEIPTTSRASSAAAVKVKDFTGKIKREEWQAEAYAHANDIGELGYVVGLMAATVAKGCLDLVERDEHGDVVELESGADPSGDREKAQRVLTALRGPTGDHRQLLAAAAVHDQIAGDGILLGTPVDKLPTVDGSKSSGAGIVWEMVSVMEVVEDSNATKDAQGRVPLIRQRSASGAKAVGSDAKGREVIDPDAYVTRYHRGDWMHSGDATSPLRRNAATCRKIVLWDQYLESQIRSRLSAGMLLFPEEVSFPVDEDGISDPTETDADRLVNMLVEHMSAPVEDRRSAASLVPMVLRVNSEFIPAFRLLALTDPEALPLIAVLEARAKEMRRLAAGIDMPLEVMEGMGDSNHWSAAGIDQASVDKHIIPLGDRLAQFFTVAYLRRMLVDFEGVSEENAERFELAFNGSEIETRVDTAVSADALHADGLISDDARIEAHGFDPEAVRPTDEERARRLAARLAVVPDKTNRPIIPAAGLTLDLLVELGVDPEVAKEWLSGKSAQPPPPQFGAPFPPQDGQEPPPDGQESGPPGPGLSRAGQPPVVEHGPPGGPTQPVSGEPGPDEEMRVVAERIRATASAAVDRALERAANRVVTSSKKLPATCRAQVELPRYRTGPAKVEVLHLVTADDLAHIGCTPEMLLRQAWDDVGPRCVIWLRDAYRRNGADRLTADEDARRAVSTLCHELDALALSAFRRPLQRDDGLAVPLRVVLDSIAAPVR